MILPLVLLNYAYLLILSLVMMDLNNHSQLDIKCLSGTNPRNSFISCEAVELPLSVKRGEVHSLICSITSLPSHMIFISQLSCAYFTTSAAVPFFLPDSHFLIIQIIKQLENAVN